MPYFLLDEQDGLIERQEEAAHDNIHLTSVYAQDVFSTVTSLGGHCCVRFVKKY